MTPARRLWTLFEPLHAVTYFAPEGRAAFEAAGYRGFWRGYFASRAAPLGPAPAAVATALFAGFAPRMVERALPSVWDLAPPSAALDARLSGSVAALSRLLGDADVRVAASLLRTVAEGAPTTGRALGAANAALPWPDEPLAVLWQAATVLRELRGDGHVLAQLAVGLDALSTMVLRAGHDLSRDSLQPHRGWTDDEWSAAADALTSRGLLDGSGRATQAGLDLLDRVEAVTDELALEPWTRAGADAADRFAELAAPLAAAAGSVLPRANPIGLRPAPDTGPFFHGTKADLAPGDLLEPGRSSNYGERRTANFVYLAATLDAAVWGAELSAGDAPGRIYRVEPTGPIEDDPNLTDQRFPGNPTRSYRTRHPLRVVEEVRAWEGHPPEVLQQMRDHLAELERQGVEAIND